MYTFSIFEQDPEAAFSFPVPDYSREGLRATTVADAQEEALQYLYDYADACDLEDGYTSEDRFWCVIYDATGGQVASATMSFDADEAAPWEASAVPCLSLEDAPAGEPAWEAPPPLYDAILPLHAFQTLAKEEEA